MGGSVDKTVRQIFIEHHHGDLLDSQETLHRFQVLVKPLAAIMRHLTTVLEDWSQNPDRSLYRLQKPDQKLLRFSCNNIGAIAINAVGMSLCILDRDGRRTSHSDGKSQIRMSHVLAHVLQGIEAEYIAILTELGPQFEFEVVSNQHDGVVTVGEISAKAAKEAVKRSLLSNYAKIVLKPFC